MIGGKRFNSRERLLRTLENDASDYVPCSFMIFEALHEKCRDDFEFIERQLELGLDARVELPELPIRFHPEVKTKEWKEVSKKGIFLYKDYYTPAGKLTSIVKKTDDWPYNDSVPLFNDYLTPRSKKFLITSKGDLKSLRYLFSEPTADDILNFREKAKKVQKFCS